MFDMTFYDNLELEERYKNMSSILEALISDDTENSLTKACNASAVINALIGDLNWCGFYLINGDELVLGPFQGMPACTKIKMGKGVCGTAAEKKETTIVYDVHVIENHITCDAATNSEIVVPIIKNDKLYGVLDLDSIKIGRFSELEKKYLEEAVIMLNKYIDWEELTKE